MHYIPEPVEMYWNLFHLMEKWGLLTTDQDMYLSLKIEDKLKPLMEEYGDERRRLPTTTT